MKYEKLYNLRMYNFPKNFLKTSLITKNFRFWIGQEDFAMEMLNFDKKIEYNKYILSSEK